jgi:hypothetical protein
VASETGTALGLGSASPAGLATEDNIASALFGVITGPVGLAVEEDTALGLSGAQTGNVGLALETNVALVPVTIEISATKNNVNANPPRAGVEVPEKIREAQVPVKLRTITLTFS